MSSEKKTKIDRFMKILHRYMKKPEDEIILQDILLELEKCTNTEFLITLVTTATENIYLNSNNIYNVLTDMKSKLTIDNVEKKVNKNNGEEKENCRYKVSEEYVTLLDDDSVILENKSNVNSFLKNMDEIKGKGCRSERFKSDNISLSSDDDYTNMQSQGMMDICDSDVEIINDNGNPGIHKQAHSESDFIQIDDSSDEDVQEIKINTNGTFTNQKNQSGNNCKKRKRKQTFSSDSKHSDQPSLANFPFIVQFPTMQNAAFNGTLFVSHNHKFSVKLQGVDPSNFQFTNNSNR